jgi:gas vesicle protein
MDNAAVELKVDVEVLKQQVLTLTQLCNKMDTIIEKLIDNNDRLTTQIYQDMDKRKQETVSDIKELHSRITTVDRNVSDKIELTERRIMDEIKSLREDIASRNKKEDGELRKIMEWKWMAAGAIVVLVWVASNIKLEMINKILGG